MLILSQAYLNGPVFEKCHRNMWCRMLISNQQIYTHIGKVLAKESNSNRLQNTQSKKQQNILNVTPYYLDVDPQKVTSSWTQFAYYRFRNMAHIEHSI